MLMKLSRLNRAPAVYLSLQYLPRTDTWRSIWSGCGACLGNSSACCTELRDLSGSDILHNQSGSWWMANSRHDYCVLMAVPKLPYGLFWWLPWEYEWERCSAFKSPCQCSGWSWKGSLKTCLFHTSIPHSIPHFHSMCSSKSLSSVFLAM